MRFKYLYHRGEYILAVVNPLPSVQVLSCSDVLRSPSQHSGSSVFEFKKAIYRKRARKDLVISYDLEVHLHCLKWC